MAGQGFTHTPVQVPEVHTRYRNIKTALPVPESLPLLQKLYAYESRSMHGQLPIVWDRAEGFQVHDAWGNIWIDFTSTIFVTNAGHGNAAIIDSLQDLLHKPLLHSYTYATKGARIISSSLSRSRPPSLKKPFCSLPEPRPRSVL
jgi:4-aminobutyrate aminotransferase-like enzyme